MREIELKTEKGLDLDEKVTIEVTVAELLILRAAVGVTSSGQRSERINELYSHYGKFIGEDVHRHTRLLVDIIKVIEQRGLVETRKIGDFK